MDSLIQDVLALTNVIRRPITLSPVNVDALVRALVRERPELSPPRAEIKIESPLLPVLSHEAMLSQCLTNLLSNAVKFVERGIVPRVRVWTEELSSAATRTDSSEPPLVRIWIEDQGIGIPAEAQARIFEIFQRLHSAAQYEGSGIGLAIVRKAVERMGGGVGVESDSQKGSRFWLELPKA
jgi:signal transduction histidine kinase